MFIDPNVAKIDLLPVSLQILQNTLPSSELNSIKLKMVYQASFQYFGANSMELTGTLDVADVEMEVTKQWASMADQRWFEESSTEQR